MSDMNMSTETSIPSTDNTTVADTNTTTTETSTTTTDSWLNNLPEDLRNSPSVTKFKDSTSAVKAYVELEKTLGNRVKIPGEGATPEEISSFYNKLGRPETKDGYSFTSTLESKQNLVDLVPEFKTQVDQFADIAHTLGLSKDVANKLVDWQLQGLEQTINAQVAAKEAAEAKLKEVWGSNVDNNMAAAQRTAQILAKKYPEEMKALQVSDGARNPMTMIMLAELANVYKESDSNIPDSNGVTTGSSAQEELQQLKLAGRDHPLWDRYHPDHAKAVARYDELTKQLY